MKCKADSRLSSALSVLILLPCLFPVHGISAESHWSNDFNRPGLYGTVLATAEFKGELIVAGNFEIAGNPQIRNIARWDGREWQALGTGLTWDQLYDRSVSCLIVFQGELVAGGAFQVAGNSPVGGLARWDGSKWRAFDTGPRRTPRHQFDETMIHALAIYDEHLVVAGTFDSAGSLPAANIAAWNGYAWSSLGSGQPAAVTEMCNFKGDLVVNVSSQGGPPQNYLHRWDGTTWSSIPGAERVYADVLVTYNDRLIVGGGFLKERGAIADLIATWDGSAWRELDSGPSVDESITCCVPYGVSHLAVYGGDLIVGGTFTFDGSSVDHLVRWNGGDWVSEGYESFSSSSPTRLYDAALVTALGFHDGNLVVGGYFGPIGEIQANGIARWNGVSWYSYGCGGGRSPGAFERLAPWNDSIVAGAHPVSLWKDNAWSPLGNLNGRLFDILIHENSVVAATGEDDPILRWTGHSWVPLGHEFFAVDLQIHDDALVGSGYLDSDVSGNSSVARWDGNAWQRIGTPFTGEPWRLTVFRGDLFATINRFAPSSSGGRLVRWTGSEWEELGSTGPEGWIYDLAVFENELVAAGFFLEMDGVPARNIARWNGERWAPLGEGVASGEAEGAIYSVEPYGDRLAVGGRFQVAGTIPAGNIAFWDGFDWTTAGSGTDGLIWDLAVLDSDLYAIGLFSFAGDQPSYGIARWTSSPEGYQCFSLTPLALAPAYPNPFHQSTRIDYSLAERGHSRITVVDVLGRPVVELVNATKTAGAHSITWDGCDRDGRKVPSGVYYIVIENGRTSGARKVIRVR